MQLNISWNKQKRTWKNTIIYLKIWVLILEKWLGIFKCVINPITIETSKRKFNKWVEQKQIAKSEVVGLENVLHLYHKFRNEFPRIIWDTCSPGSTIFSNRGRNLIVAPPFSRFWDKLLQKTHTYIMGGIFCNRDNENPLINFHSLSSII